MQKKLFFAFFLAACGSPNDEQTSNVSYGTFSPGSQIVRQWSAYTTIEENDCTLPMEIQTRGTQITPAQNHFLRKELEDSVRKWTGILKSPYWRCGQAKVKWASHPKGVKVIIDSSVTRAYALVGQYQVVLGPNLISGDPNGGKVILHEMGHMFGLADAYTEPGYQTPINQPPSLMNNLYQVAGLQEDDIKGANNLYEYINQRAPFCTDGYTVGGAYENRNQVAFCVPLQGGKQFQTPPPSTASDRDRWLKAHNVRRCMHGVPPLKWSLAAEAAAQSWANTCRFAHETQRPYGENLAWGTAGWFTPERAAYLWYRENLGYPYGSATPPYSTMHFTQMVWRETTELGCARKTCGWSTYFVCRYSKRGNVLSYFAPQVPRPVKTEAQCGGAPL